MDALAEVLRAIKIDAAIYLNGEFSEPWCVLAPEATILAPLFGRDGAHVIVYHLLCEGRARCEIDDGDAIDLSAGDLIALPHGHSHRIGNGRYAAPIDVTHALPGLLERGLAPLSAGGGGTVSKFICGYLACDRHLSQAFVAAVPWEHEVRARRSRAGPRERAAGVLLVFCYLIVPSVAAMLFAENIGPRLAIGWTMGTIVSALGV